MNNKMEQIIEFRMNATEQHIAIRVISSEVSDEKISAVEGALAEMMEIYESEHGDFCGFCYENAIDEAFIKVGLKADIIKPHKVIYV